MAYLPKYLTRQEPKGKIRLTERDITIIRAVWRFRFLTTEDVISLVNFTGKTKTKINARLRELFDNDYLDRPEIQDKFFGREKVRPVVHALGQAGAKHLKELDDAPIPATVNWRRKNKTYKGEDQLMHTLGVTDVHMRFMALERDNDKIQVRDQVEIINRSPPRTQRMPHPLTFETKFRWKDGRRDDHSTIPDGLIALHDQLGEEPTKSFYFLEFDRGTESVRRSGKKQSSIVQKMLGYGDIYNRGMHKQRFPYNNFRVLFVTTTHDHIETMIEGYDKEVTNKVIGAGAFLFATHDDFIAYGPLGDIWVNAKNEPTNLLPHFRAERLA